MEHKTLYAALAAAQAELKSPEKTKTATVSGVTKSGKKYEYNFKYADIADILEHALPVLSRHGLSVTQPTEIRDGTIVLKTVLHFDTQQIASEYPVCRIDNSHQSMGSALTYARRYALTSLIGIAPQEDTDGEGAAPAGEQPQKKLTSHEAKTEIDWPAVEKSIDDCETFVQLSKRAELVEKRRSVWPETYYWKAKERIEFNRLQLVEKRFSECSDLEQLAECTAEIEGVLDGVISSEEIVVRYQKREQELETQ